MPILINKLLHFVRNFAPTKSYKRSSLLFLMVLMSFIPRAEAGWLTWIKDFFIQENSSTLMLGPGDPACVNTNEIGGLVFQDYNANGIKDVEEPFLYGASVSLYDDNGQVGSTIQTDGNGVYLFTSLSVGEKYRLEFTLPMGMQEGPVGADSKSSVQVVTAGTCDASIGFLDPTDYCDADPFVVIPCYAELEYDGTYTNEPALAKLLYSADGHHFTGTNPTADFAATKMAVHNDIGAVYGMAYQRTHTKMYMGAYHKRYVDYGPNGPDAIYQIDTASAITGILEFDALLGASNTTGADPHDFTPSSGEVYDIGTANASFDGPGKRAFGDLEISDDNKTLYVVNLFDRKIYAIDVSTGNVADASILTSWNAPDETGAGRHRPFALAWHRGKLWVGSVDENASNAYIHSLNPAGTTFDLELTVDLSYSRQAIVGDNANDFSGSWNAWTSDPETTAYGTYFDEEIFYPQAMLTDIEFDGESMILGFRDRFGDQSGGEKLFKTSATEVTWGDAGGDILKVCYNNGTYTLEDGLSGTCAGVGGISPSGPGGVEFYHWDAYHHLDTWNPNISTGALHWETTQGGLLQLDGKPSILTTAMDPFHDFSGGVLKLNNTDGGREGVGTGSSPVEDLTGGYTLYESGDYVYGAGGGPPVGNGTAQKGNGLGDLEAFCSPAPLELGNLVWIDANSNGIQDPSEAGLAGVVVSLTDASDVSLGTTTTDADGKYSFTSGNISGELAYFTTYKVKIDFGDVQQINAALNGLSVQNAGNGFNDNAATQVGATAEISITTGGPGDTDFALDFGFVETGVVGNRIWIDENSDGIQDAGEPGVPGVVVELVSASCTSGSDCPTTITDANGGYLFSGVGIGNYTVKVLSNVPASLNAIYDEDEGTTAPDMSTAVTVSAGGEYVTADFGYNYVAKNDTDSPTAAITGALGNRVWNDANSNGIQDPGESGIPNITVTLMTDPDLDGIYTSSTTTTTDAYGNYIFDNINPDAYVVEISETDLTSAGFNTTPTFDPDNDSNNTSEPIIIAPGDTWLGGDFGYTSAGTPADIGSTVFVDVNVNGTYEAGNDLPLGGVTLALIADANGNKVWDIGEAIMATTSTAGDGTYLFPDLPAGDYVVAVTDANNVINTLNISADPEGNMDGRSGLTLAAVDNLVQNFGYIPAGHSNSEGFIGDLIFLDADNSNSYSAGDQGIEGVEVQLLNGNDDSVLGTAFTNENGRYFFGGLSAANYKVKVLTASLPTGLLNSIDPDGSSPGMDQTMSFALASGAHDLSNDFGYAALASPGRMIGGTLWQDEDADGDLVADPSEGNRFEGVTLTLLDGDQNIIAETTTQVDGTYSFTGLPATTFTVHITDAAGTLSNYWHSPTSGTDNEANGISVDLTTADVTGVDFGYFIQGASLGNTVWEDKNANGLQDLNEPGIPGVKLLLEIDYDNDATADITVAKISDNNGYYQFGKLLLDEDYDGTGSSPDFTIKAVQLPGYSSTTTNVASNANDNKDADDPTGVLAFATKGVNAVTQNVDPTMEPIAAQYDFGFLLAATVGNRVWIDENADGIQDAGEPGIPGVVVELQSAACTSGSDCPTTITDLDGGYIFTNVTPGTYTVKVLSNVPAILNAIYDEDSGTTSPNMEAVVMVNSASEYVTADFGYNYVLKEDSDAPTLMTEPVAIGNRVWNDVNSNGIQDPGESGIKGVTVELWTDAMGTGVYTPSGTTRTTDANGNYIFEGLSPMAYQVKVDESTLPAAFNTTPTGDPDQDSDNISEMIIMAPGDVWLGGDFGYNAGGTLVDIGSMVYVDVDGDGSYAMANDLPLAGVSLALVEDANMNGVWDIGEVVVATTITAADGSYLFADLVDGDYVVAITDTKNVINDLTNSVDPDGGTNAYSQVNLASSDNLIQNFGFVPAGHSNSDGFIGDLIFLDADASNSYSAGDQGIEGVEVQLLNGDNNSILATTKTSENGMYFFGNLPAANYKVKVVTSSLPAGLMNSIDPDGSSPGMNETASFALAAGTGDLTNDFGYMATLSPAREISGTFWKDTDADGELIADASEMERFIGVSLDLLDANGNVLSRTTTLADGTYSFTGLPAGIYTVAVTDADQKLANYWHSPTSGSDNEADRVAVDVTSADVSGIDFGYYIQGAAVGNLIWIDKNQNDQQDANEPGMPGAKVTLEIDYNGGGTDLSVHTLTERDGHYAFKGLLMDEDYNGDGLGTEPTYKLVVSLPDADMNNAYVAVTSDQAGGNDKLDSDLHAGQVFTAVQGQGEVANLNNSGAEETAGSYDFGYYPDCVNPVVEYAITSDGSTTAGIQTTDYFTQIVNGDTSDVLMTQEHGYIQSWTYCETGSWRYYYNPLDPDEYLFAIEMGSNTTEIDYVGLRVDSDATNRHSANAQDATFVMGRDWYVKTVNGAALNAPVNIRFYFPPNEFEQMYDAAVAQASTWGVSTPAVSAVKWFMVDVFDPTTDVNPDGSNLTGKAGYTDMTSSRLAASTVDGDNTALTVPAIENSINHIQFNGVTDITGGTAFIQINRAALPVELAAFSAQAEGCGIRLNWTSITEEEFDSYELERSFDGRRYAPIAQLEGKGGLVQQSYTFMDKQAARENYYRLKMNNLDGSFEYSEIVVAQPDCVEEEGMFVFPNPIGKQESASLSVRFYSENKWSDLVIIDGVGRQLIAHRAEVIRRDWNVAQIDVSSLPVGLYFVKDLSSGISRRFVITEQ